MARRSIWLACALLAVLVTVWFTRRSADPELATAARASDAAQIESARTPELADDSLAPSAAAETSRVDVTPAPVAQPSVPATMVIGRVLAPDGKPIVGARVRRGTADELERARLDPRASFELGERELATPSDIEGRFVFASVPRDGEVLIVGPTHEDFAADLGWTIARPGAECVLTMSPLASGELVIEALRLPAYEPLPYFTAHVTQLDRNGSRGLRGVNAQGSDGEARATLRFLPGAAVEVELGIPTMAIGRGPSTVRIVTPIAGEAVTARFEIDPLAEPTDAGMFVATGVVLDRATREPLAGASVSSGITPGKGNDADYRAGLRNFSTRSDSQGRFRVRLAGSSATLVVSAPRHRTTEVAVVDRGDVVVELDRGAQLTIRVQRADGRPAKQRVVTLQQFAPGATRASFAGIATNDEGVGERSDLAPGTWEVRVARAAPSPSTGAGQNELLGPPGTSTSRGEDAWLVRTVELSLGEATEVLFEVDD
ncbi:MAG: carboxypeptidase-like regulatory domain-containing protein [Planctomycetes bacterium]|nr:carboxypeptidase-like regulatory domain-containing protein [Planctomycetota bacterium]